MDIFFRPLCPQIDSCGKMLLLILTLPSLLPSYSKNHKLALFAQADYSYMQGLLPVVQCFSCMSKNLQNDFQYLSKVYLPPKQFDDRCNEPFLDKNVPVVNCSNICVTLKEQESKLGMVLGYNYIRGCLDKLFVPGVLNQSALETHGFHFADLCRALPWRQLVNLPPGAGAQRPNSGNNGHYGQVVLCSCYGNRCNGRGGQFQDSRSTKLRATCALLLSMCLWRLINNRT